MSRSIMFVLSLRYSHYPSLAAGLISLPIFVVTSLLSILRQGQEQAQRNLFQKAKIATFLIENCVPYPEREEDLPPKGAPLVVIQRAGARGLVMNCLNAIRLQSSCQAPSSFLRQFLRSHQRWTEFLPTLLVSAAGHFANQYVFWDMCFFFAEKDINRFERRTMRWP
jgi:hypothetical protein